MLIYGFAFDLPNTTDTAGRFLMALFHVDSLTTKTKVKDVRKALDRPPPQLDESYQEIWRRIQGQPEEFSSLATRVLLWVSKSYTPLSLKALQHALATEEDSTSLDDADLDDEVVVLSVCKGLVHLEEQTGTLRLVRKWNSQGPGNYSFGSLLLHRRLEADLTTDYTAQEFLEKESANLFPNAQRSIALACIKYLSLDIGPSPLHLNQDPFFEYAALHWGTHTRGDLEVRIMDTVLSFFRKPLNVAFAYRIKFIRRKFFGYDRRTDLCGNHGGRSLNYAAAFGLRYVVDALINSGLPADSKDPLHCTALMRAAKRGYDGVVDLLLSHHHVDATGEYPTPLTLAAQNGKVSIVRLLVSKHADLQRQDDMDAALSDAAHGKYASIARLLIESGANLERPNQQKMGMTPLLRAMEHFNSGSWPSRLSDCAQETPSQRAILELMEEKHADFQVTDDDGRTALHLAAGCTLDVFEFVLHHGLEIHTRDHCGETVLFAALRQHYNEGTRIVERLLNLGAEVDCTNSSDRTPLHIALEYHCGPRTVELLLDKGAPLNAKATSGTTPLHLASKQITEPASLTVLKLLLEKGSVDLNVTDGDGLTPLYYACSHYYDEVVKYLVSQGANVNSTDVRGRTPLHRACFRGYENIVRYLVSQGANVNSTDVDWTTPLHCACSHGDEEVIKYLVSQGANVNSTDVDGTTPLHCVCSYGNDEVIKYLVSQGANFNSTDLRGRTPLHHVCALGYEDVVEYLISQGANVNSTDVDGMTPLHCACSDGQEEVIKYLVSQGANFNSTDVRGRTPLHCACLGGHGHVIRSLVLQGADLSVKDVQERTAFDIVSEIHDEFSVWVQGEYRKQILELLNDATTLPRGS
ncbi:MAG: hypothetical protein Q9163_005304 [Psora crenata]